MKPVSQQIRELASLHLTSGLPKDTELYSKLLEMAKLVENYEKSIEIWIPKMREQFEVISDLQYKARIKKKESWWRRFLLKSKSEKYKPQAEI